MNANREEKIKSYGVSVNVLYSLPILYVTSTGLLSGDKQRSKG